MFLNLRKLELTRISNFCRIRKSSINLLSTGPAIKQISNICVKLESNEHFNGVLKSSCKIGYPGHSNAKCFVFLETDCSLMYKQPVCMTLKSYVGRET